LNGPVNHCRETGGVKNVQKNSVVRSKTVPMGVVRRWGGKNKTRVPKR